MKQYELYVPLCDNDGADIDPAKLQSLKADLREKLGGLTHFPQETEGQWTTGGLTFHDRIVILRVLTWDDPATREWFRNLRERLTAEYGQEDFLITQTEVQKV